MVVLERQPLSNNLRSKIKDQRSKDPTKNVLQNHNNIYCCSIQTKGLSSLFAGILLAKKSLVVAVKVSLERPIVP